MKNKLSKLIWLVPLLFTQTLSGQKHKTDFSGYVKNLQTWSWTKETGNLQNDGFLHNRLIFKWFPDSLLTFDVEIRNRLFYGETVKDFPGYADLLDQDNGAWDGSFILTKSKTLILNTQLDRLWFGWEHGRWEIRLGRQRINWGIATTWNPNDLFNAYNFLDFDYGERPGSDALRIQYRTGSIGKFELACSPAKSSKNRIGAVRYLTNWRQYDWQFIAGRYHDQWTAGMGWAGSLGTAGFKGECSVFKSDRRDSSATVSLTAQVDHLFPGEWYVSGGFLYAGGAANGVFRPEQLASTMLEPGRLMPVRWSILTTVVKPVTPILQGSLTALWSPNSNLLLLMPSLAYNIRENWDVDLTGQLFFLEQQGKAFSNRFDAVYLRLQCSF